MPAFVALAGWPAAEPPAGAWSAQLGDDLPVALLTEPGPGPVATTATSADGRLHAALVGTLANRRELEEAVGRSGAAGTARNDAALVLRLYEGRGEQSASALRGGFAFALWDGRRGRLVMARDQLGVQALFYAAARGSCVAATRLAPLLRIPGLAGSPDVALLDVILALGTVPAPATVYPGIRQVCPGELLVWEPGRLRAQRYWQLRFPDARDTRRTVAREAVRRVREQLDESVRIRTAGVVTGVLLSGGLGAGSVLALASALDRRPAVAVTVAGDRDEVQHAAGLARRAQVEHESVRPEIDWAAAADAALATHGAPVGGMDEPLLAAAAAALGGRVRALLGGCGAEDVLGGGPAERTWAACERYRALPGLARECVDILAAAGRPRRLAWIVRAARSAPVDVFAGIDVALGAEERGWLYAPGLRPLMESAPTDRSVGALVGDAVSQGATDAGDVLYAVRLALGVPRTVGRLAASLAPDADVTWPLADTRVAQTSAAVPARVRASMRRRAALLQQAVAAELPRDVQRQAHRDLLPPPEAWRDGSLRAVVEDTLAPERVARLALFDAAAIARLRAAHAAGRHELGAVLWRLVLVSRWLDRPARTLDEGYSSAPLATSAVIASSS
jgi:asparagine synthase (glutamine-hydrolysing)